jgi:glutamate dehydrogenase
MDERDQVRLHFYLAALTENVRTVSAEELRTQCASLLRTWDDRLSDLLLGGYEREPARALIERYTLAFSNVYKAATDVTVALGDIRWIEALRATRTPQVDLVNDGTEERFTALKLYVADSELVLSDFLPVLENLGLKVFAESSVSVTVADVGAVRIHTFLVQDSSGARLDVASTAPLLKPALLMLQAGAVENDRLNGLILGAGLDWRQMDLLRTYVHHGVQIGTAPTRTSLMLALLGAPHSARILWEYFETKFSPQRAEAADDRLTHILPGLEQRFTASLETVQSVADDRMLRALFSAVAATLRTNFFCLPPATAQEAGSAAADRPQPAIAVKLACARIPHMPRPHPAYEIYVHAPHVEALHLRGAQVARGGIRLSDRPDDFRTEILDLMKTQMVKNAVIVPAGAKGGFIAKHRPGTLLSADQIVAAYRTFISALLDLTDNVVRGQLASPAGMVCYDGPDPYLGY